MGTAFLGFYLARHGLTTLSSIGILGTLIFGVLTGFLKVLKYGLDLREKHLKGKLEDQILHLREQAQADISQLREQARADSEEAAATASLKVLSHWKIVARHHEDGMYNANRQLRPALQFNTDEFTGAEAIDSYLKAIIAVFDGFYETHTQEFSANLAIPNSDGSKLWLVRIEPGGSRRSNPLPREIDLSTDAWGAAVAYKTGKIIYTADVRLEGNPGDRGYLSVANLPIEDSAGKVIGVVNIDSPEPNGFGSEESVKEVAEYCWPICSSISLCLADLRLFKAARE